jgi:hypothetical protein
MVIMLSGIGVGDGRDRLIEIFNYCVC